MLAILSPAKRLYEGPAVPDLPHTEPVLLDETAKLAKVAARLKPADVVALMDVSDELATLNVGRFRAFELPFTPDNARQAARMFAGDTYLGLDAASLTPDDLRFAQDRLVILSGLYGVLRPLDLMQPYRLEMGTKLRTPRGKDLYAWWGDRLADQLTAWLDGHADRTIVDLASSEYSKAARLDRTGARVVVPVFQDVKDGRARTLFMFAKKGRGAAARWLVQQRADRADALKDAEIDGYRFVAAESDATRWVFQRPQPPKQR